MKRALVIAAGLGVFVLGAVFLYPRPVDHPQAPAEAPTPSAPDAGKAKPRRSLLPKTLPADPPPKPDAAPTQEVLPPSPTNAPDATALAGAEFITIDDGLREKLEVPDDSQIGRGVVVRNIHPDSPAAEIFMRPNDVIVRAALKKVDTVEDLQRLVGDRDHTLITISRDGVLMQMVLKKPFRAK